MVYRCKKDCVAMVYGTAEKECKRDNSAMIKKGELFIRDDANLLSKNEGLTHLENLTPRKSRGKFWIEITPFTLDQCFAKVE
jgi:hypothetical protein